MQFSDTQFCSLPMLVQTNEMYQILVTEADLYDYPCMFIGGTSTEELRGIFPKSYLKLEQKGDRNEKVIEEANYIANAMGPHFSWRVLL